MTITTIYMPLLRQAAKTVEVMQSVLGVSKNLLPLGVFSLRGWSEVGVFCLSRLRDEKALVGLIFPVQVGYNVRMKWVKV